MDELEDIKRRITELETWKRQREQQQIVAPLDHRSIEAINEFFPRIKSTIWYLGGVSGKQFGVYLGNQGALELNMGINDYTEVTVNASNDTFTSLGDWTPTNNDEILFASGDIGVTLPSPLSPATTYYVVSASGKNFKVSATIGGSAINITNNGNGKTYIYYF